MKWLGGVMLVLLSLTGNAQKTVFQNLTWEQAAELAQKENKIILVDAMREPATPEARKQKDKEEAVWQTARKDSPPDSVLTSRTRSVTKL